MKRLAKTKLIWLAVALLPLLVAIGCGGDTPPSSDYYSEFKRNYIKSRIPTLDPMLLPDTIEEFCRQVAHEPTNSITCYVNVYGEYRITDAPNEVLTRENIYPPVAQNVSFTREYCETLALNGRRLSTCIELPYGLLVVVGIENPLLDEYPQYPSPAQTQMIIREFCEAYAPVRDLSQTACIELEGAYQLVDTNSPLLDEYPLYPPSAADIPQLGSVKEFCEWLALMPNFNLTCIETENEFGYDVVGKDDPLLDEYPEYPRTITP